jgi:hypothetical protein
MVKPTFDTLSPLMDTIEGIIVEPYKTFFAHLYAAQRVTNAEMTELRKTCEDRIVHLRELVNTAIEDAANADATSP